MFILSCTKEDTNTKSFVLRASLEQEDSKANLDGLAMKWVDGDQIGVYVNDSGWTDRVQPFELDGGANTTQGTFKWVYNSGNFTNTNATYAFYPYNIVNGNSDATPTSLTFNLPATYYNYKSGLSLCPLVAPVSYNSTAINYDDMQFAYVGGAVKVTVKNLPGTAHSIGFTVNGQTIRGAFSISNPSSTDEHTINSTTGTDSQIWLNFDTEGNRFRSEDFTFILPVPAIPSSKMSFVIYDIMGRTFINKTTKAQPAVPRAGLLAMPELDLGSFVIPGTGLDENTSDSYFLAGNHNGWGADRMPYKLNGWYAFFGVSFPANGEFKIRTSDKNWDTVYPSGDNYKINNSAAGVYDIYFNTSDNSIEVYKVS